MGVPLSWLSAALIFSSLQGSSGDFRFCSRGPHRIRDKDCIGGFFANVPLNVTCAYYKASPTLNPDAKAQLTQDFCEDKTLMELPAAGDMITITKLQEYSIENAVPTFAMQQNLTNAAFPSEEPTQCGEECLADWRNPDEIEPEDHLIDKPPPEANATPSPDANGTADTNQTSTSQVVTRMMMNLMIEENFEEDDPNQILPIEDPLENPNLNTTQRLTLLLSKVMRITLKNCAPYVESPFLTQVLKAMMFLNSLNKKAQVDIGIDEFNVIDDHLDKCLAMNNTKFKLVGTNCSGYQRLTGIRYPRMPVAFDETWQYRITQRSFFWGEYDLVVEAAFAAINFVHGHCFHIFADNLAHYHLFHVGMEALFPEDPVLTQWANPVDLPKGPSFWNSVLDTSNIQVAMRNLDGCAIAGLFKSPYKHILERIFTSEDQLSNPTYKPVPWDSEGGWPDTIEAYWKWYDRRGGFPALSGDMGNCVRDRYMDPDTRKEIIKDITTKNCPGNDLPEPTSSEEDQEEDTAASP